VRRGRASSFIARVIELSCKISISLFSHQFAIAQERFFNCFTALTSGFANPMVAFAIVQLEGDFTCRVEPQSSHLSHF
jgi:hypothetical protein